MHGLGIAFCIVAVISASPTAAQKSNLAAAPRGVVASNLAATTAGDQATPPPASREERYRLCASDVIALTFPLTPEFDQTINIQPDGFASLAGAGDVKLEGLTTQQSADVIRAAYSKILHDPVVTIELKDFNRPYFVVTGQVNHPGKFDLRGDTSASEAIAIAGGFMETAKHSQVLLFRRVNDGWYEVKPLNLKGILAGHDVNEDAEIRSGDMLYANLECALNAHGLSPRALNGLGQIVSAPCRSLDYLAAIRALPLGIANNHIFDFGPEGLRRTREIISRAGFVPLGSVDSRRHPPETYVWHGPGSIRIGFWAAARASRDLATRNRPGVEPATLERASEAHQRLKTLGATFSIALVHAGHLRTCRPDPSDLRLLDGIAKRGFDLVAASHSHRISGAKLLPSASRAASFCFYGLGSIASGYVASEREREGLIVVAGFHHDGGLACVEVRPVAINGNGFGEIPAPLAARLILDRFRNLSREITDGSSNRLFYQDISRGFARLYLRDASAAYRESGLRGLIRKAGRVRVKHLRGAVQGLLR